MHLNLCVYQVTKQGEQAVSFLADETRGEGLGGHTISESDCFAPAVPNEKFNVSRCRNRQTGPSRSHA